MSRTAKLFSNGGSQAVRLPVEFRFDGDLVYVRRDERTGDVILSARPRTTWSEFIELRKRLGPLSEGLAERDQPQEQRDPFEGWKE